MFHKNIRLIIIKYLFDSDYKSIEGDEVILNLNNFS